MPWPQAQVILRHRFSSVICNTWPYYGCISRPPLFKVPCSPPAHPRCLKGARGSGAYSPACGISLAEQSTCIINLANFPHPSSAHSTEKVCVCVCMSLSVCVAYVCAHKYRALILLFECKKIAWIFIRFHPFLRSGTAYFSVPEWT